MSTEKVTAEQLETGSVPPAEKKSFIRKVRDYLKWYHYLAGFLLFVLGFMLITTYAVVPVVAQSKVDKSYLTLNSLDILEPRPDGFKLSLNSTLGGAHTKATIGAFTADFFLKDGKNVPFIQVDLPPVKVGGKGAIFIAVKDRPTNILSGEAFAEFGHNLFASEEYSVDVKGRAELKVVEFKPKVDYRERVTSKGLNGLKGLKIEHGYDTYTNGTLAPGGWNIVGKVTIPNPSVVTIEVGTVKFDMSTVEGESMGSGELPNLKLIPGTHQYDFQAKTDLRKLLVVAASAAFKGEKPYLDITGTDVTYNGVHIPWLTSLLSADKIKAEMSTEL